jgi:BirA family biotin operon repressor/biotin-[acetyl-CoA-carboxylase] ligase
MNIDLTVIEPEINYYIFEQIPSTNEKVWQLIDRGVKLPIVAIARQQTAGKGQRGHQWRSPLGGLYLSLGLSLDLPVNCANHLTLFSAWGIVENLRKYQIPVRIKWLNDLILADKKLGGILSETRIERQKIKQAVIGVGINWNNPVPLVGINLQSVVENQVNPRIDSLDQLASLTIAGILNGYQYYLTEGIDNLVLSYQQLLHNLGQKILLQGGEGVVTGITSKGELKLCLRSLGATTEILLPPGNISLGYPE